MQYENRSAKLLLIARLASSGWDFSGTLKNGGILSFYFKMHSYACLLLRDFNPKKKLVGCSQNLGQLLLVSIWHCSGKFHTDSKYRRIVSINTQQYIILLYCTCIIEKLWTFDLLITMSWYKKLIINLDITMQTRLNSLSYGRITIIPSW